MKLRHFADSFSLSRILRSKPALLKTRELDQLRAENARYKALLDAAPIGHFTLDCEYRIIEVNPVGAMLLRCATKDLTLTPFISKIRSDDRIHVSDSISGTTVTGDCTVSTSLKIQNREVPVMLHVTTVNPSNNKDYRFHVAMLDLSEHHATQNNLRIARDGLQHVANHDPLTRLPNRCGLIEQLQSAVTASPNEKVALLLLDLDQFKQVNDPLGHQIGDQLLREVASRLLSTVSEADTVGRLGGDEFAIILKGISGVAEVARIAEKVSKTLEKRYFSATYDVHLSASIGISVYPDHTDNSKKLLSYADAAMNDAKHRGRNLIQFYTSALNTRLTQRFELERDLRIALSESQFELYYQPQLDLRTNSVSGYEVLLRWNHPQDGVIGPDSFIGIIEDTGLIDPVGEWILEEACRKLIQLRRTNNNIKFSINVSAKQLVKGDLKDKISAILENTGVPANAIELELTESALLENADHSLKILQDLRDAGVDLAIDDFGTGYSSFSRLQQLPVTRVKIDRSFVHDVPGNVNNATIAKAIIAVAHDLGIEVVAEGVETPQQASFLSDATCDVLQGYHVGRPCTFAQICISEAMTNSANQLTGQLSDQTVVA